MTGQNVRLTDADAQLIQRMRRGNYADPEFDPYKVRSSKISFYIWIQIPTINNIH